MQNADITEPASRGRARGGELKALSTVTVRAGQDRASFGNVPVEEIGTFAAALAKVKLPERVGD